LSARRSNVEWVRYGNIGIAVGTVLIVIAVLVFRHSEAAMQAGAMLGGFIGLGVALFLEGRAAKRRERDPQ
jgi:hypothetical protein